MHLNGSTNAFKQSLTKIFFGLEMYIIAIIQKDTKGRMHLHIQTKVTLDAQSLYF